MSEYRETRTVVEEVPIKRARPVTETQYATVVTEERGISGGAIAALVLAAIAAAVVITILILNSRQSETEDQLALERARTAAAQQATSQQPSQPSQQPIIVMPSQPSTVQQVPVPVPSQPVPAAVPSAPTSTELEIDVNSKFLDDQELKSSSIDVKVSGSTALLSGRVPNQDLKTRAEKIAKTVRGIRSVINNIVVQE
ncbi:MAG: BON domain-containing protein [Acidobacteriota bacterium]